MIKTGVRTPRLRCWPAVILFAVSTVPAAAQTTVFTETFSRSDVPAPGTINGTGTPTSYTISGTGTGAGTTNASVAAASGNSYLVLDGTIAGNGSKSVAGAIPGGSGFSTTLSQNQTVTWGMNFKQNFANSSGGNGGFGVGSYGLATVLAASSTDLSTASGYAVILGSNGNSDRVDLVRFVNGLSNQTSVLPNVQSVRLSSLNSGNQQSYASAKVDYTAATNTWALSVRNDGTSAWADPLTGYTGVSALAGTGSVEQIGNGQSTLTNIPLANFGFDWNYGATTISSSQFDNFSLAFTPVPEPATVGLLAAVGLGLARLTRRCRPSPAGRVTA